MWETTQVQRGKLRFDLLSRCQTKESETFCHRHHSHHMCRVLLTNEASVIGRHYLPAKKSENLAVNESCSTDFFLSPMLADVSPAAGSDLMSLGSTGISVSEGPL